MFAVGEKAKYKSEIRESFKLFNIHRSLTKSVLLLNKVSDIRYSWFVGRLLFVWGNNHSISIPIIYTEKFLCTYTAESSGC